MPLASRAARKRRPTRPVSGVRSSAGADPGPERFPTENPGPAESAVWECSLILQSFEIAFQQFLGLRRKREFPPQLAGVLGFRDTITESALDGGCAWDAAQALGVCGDWANGGRVEGAWLSGSALARRVLDCLAAG